MSEYNRGGPVSLYLHFPFCERKCRYCDFLSGPAGEETREEYVDLLCREIELRAGEITAPSESAAAVDSIFIGGGTPSLMMPVQPAPDQNILFRADQETGELQSFLMSSPLPGI